IFTTYISNSLPVKTGDGRGYSVAVAPNGNIFATGYTENGGDRFAFVVEYGPAGNQIAFTIFQAIDPVFTSPFQYYSRSEGHGIAIGNDGGVYVVGAATYTIRIDPTDPNDHPLLFDSDAFIMKFGSDLLPDPNYSGGGIGGPTLDTG